MPPKRGQTTLQGKQATLAFHGSSNKVTKPGRGTSDKTKLAEKSKHETALSDSIVQDKQDISKLTTAERAIVQQTQKTAQTKLTPEEEEASKVSDAQIKRYWRKKEEARLARRVHQEGLSIHEKVLREFDTTGHFGPCIGISRQKRWKRAHRLGLKPPIEVLAVLMKEGRNNARVQRAHVDELMASRFADD